MKKIIVLTLFLSVFFQNCEKNTLSQYNPNEIIFVVEMTTNKEKSSDDIAKFSRYYTNEVKKTEPNSMGWGFYESGNKVMLIERYLNDEAMMQHGRNVSEGGPLQTQFSEFMEHFMINKIDVYGDTSDELKEYVKGFGLLFNFHPALGKFSRN